MLQCVAASHILLTMKTTTTQNEVLISEIVIKDSGIYADATCGKTKAYVCITSYEFRVIVQNASHKAWRGCGRGFRSVKEAIDAYKSEDVKAIIRAIDARNA